VLGLLFSVPICYEYTLILNDVHTLRGTKRTRESERDRERERERASKREMARK